MIKLTTLAAMMLSLNSFAIERPVISTGKLERKVVVSYENNEMKERSFEGKCRGAIGTRMEENSFDYTFSSFACTTGIATDGYLRFKIEGQNVYKTNRRGDINDQQDPVGTYIDGIVSIVMSDTTTRKFPAVKLDEKGCPTIGMEMKEYELRSSLLLSFKYGEKNIAYSRVASNQAVVPHMKKVENCKIPYYSQNIIVSTKDSIKGELANRTGEGRE